MEATLAQLPDKRPITVTETTDESELLAVMNKCEVNQLPVLNKDGCPIKLHLRSDLQPRILLSVPHIGGLEQQYVEEAV